MARPKHNNPELFTVGEIAHAVELPLRNLQFLADNDLTPKPRQEAQGRSGAALHDLAAFQHFAMVGGIHKAGLSLALAARLALVIPDEFNDGRIEYMSGLGRQSLDGMDGWGEVAPEGGDTGFWLHHWLRITAAPAYVPGASWENDIAVRIADRRYVLIELHEPVRARQMKRIFGDLLIDYGADPVCEIEDTPHGPRAMPVYQRPEWKTPDGQRALLDEYRNAVRHAVGTSRANISLAIRRALDRVHDMRMEKGGKLFPQ